MLRLLLLLLTGVVLLDSCGPSAAPAARSSTALVYRDFYLRHNDIPTQVEVPDRLRVIIARLKESGLMSQLVRIEAPPADLEWITQVHTKEHVERIRQACLWLKDGYTNMDTTDVAITGRTFDVAVCAVGGVLAGVDAVMNGKVRNAFCAVRPPGHHALPDRPMGFCIFNNVAIAARYLQRRYGLKKILIVDWDCHHGNGTQEIFYDDPDVFYFSTHQSPFYPRTGQPSEKGGPNALGTKLNVPLAKGAGNGEILKAYKDQLEPAARAFRPEFILISAGFDAAKGDLLGGLSLTPEGYMEMTRIVKGLAAELCQGRLVSTLEGGYSLKQLPPCVEAHVRALLE
ncbi:MAG TPA: histone deacetylase [Planctomycetota bacterium]|nr:histone deacetylase [Planctomycetota bacterium]